MKGRVSRLFGRQWRRGQRPPGRLRRWFGRHLATRRQRFVAGALVLVVLAGILIPLLMPPQKAAAAAWFAPTWSYRRQITLNNSASAENLVNFPIRVSLTSTNISYANTQDAGQDLRFTDSDGTTLLPYEIEKWDEAGTSEVWVRVPQIDASSTTDSIYMYYGNSTVADGQTPASVWSSSFALVQHLEETGSCSIAFTDSTVPSSDGVCSGGGPAANSSGKIGAARTFDGIDDALPIGVDAAFDPGATAFTVEAWIKASSVTSFQALFSHAVSGSGAGWDFYIDTGGVLAFWDGATDRFAASSGLSNNTWAHVALVRSGTSITFYVNGTSVGSATIQTTIPSASVQLKLGEDEGGGGHANTSMDEARYAQTNRSAAWIKAEYVTSNNTMNSFGSEQSGTYSLEGQWSYRRQVVFNNTPSTTNLSNFPVRISLNSSRINYTNTQNSGQDLRFTDSDGVTPLQFEIEKWDEAGTSEAWVKVPQIDAGSVTDSIYMYYGNTTVLDGQNETGTWDSNFALVQHLGDSSALAATQDSTANSNDGAKLSVTEPTPYSAGKIDGAQDFDGGVSGDDSLEVANSASLQDVTEANFTLSAWMNPDSTPTGTGNLDYGILAKTGFHTGMRYTNGNNIDFGVYNTSDTNFSDASSATYAPGEWHQVAMTVATATKTVSLYVDGVFDKSFTYTGTLRDYGTATFKIGRGDLGACSADWNWCFDGKIDEARISNTNRSADWIKAEYRTDTDSFNTFGTEETAAGGSGAWCNDTTDVTCTNAWAVRRPVRLINAPSSSNLTDFPVLITLNSSNIDYGQTQNNGEDIRFVDPSDPNTVLPHEIETWNESGNSYVWVKVPQLDAGSNSDYIWMYYGNSSVPDGQNAANVWSNDYGIVYHMDEPSGNLSDSAGTAQNAVRNGSTVSQTTGEIGSAQDFSSTGYTATASPGLPTGDFTYELWAYLDTNNDEAIFGGYADTSSPTSSETRLYAAASYTEIDVNDVFTTSIPALATGTWYHLTMTRSGSNVTLYRDGVPIGTLTEGTTLNFSTCSLLLGVDPDSGCLGSLGNYLDGRIDEFRVSNVAKSADWTKASYLSGSNVMATFGPLEYSPPDPPTLTALTGGTISTTPTFQLRTTDQSSPSYLRYKIEICATSDCSSILRTADQTASQTGWSGQDAQTGTAYVASSTLASSTLASYTYQAPALTVGTQYWWRAYAIDPAGSNTWSASSDISTFVTAAPPAAPTLLEPVAGSSAPDNPAFRLWTTDPNSDYVQYKIELCADSGCTSVIRTIDQTSSQTGWNSQNANSLAAYTTAPVLTNGSQQAIHVYQAPPLPVNTQYWWRAYAIDPAGSNTWSSASGIGTFSTNQSIVRVLGGTKITGGTKIGN